MAVIGILRVSGCGWAIMNNRFNYGFAIYCAICGVALVFTAIQVLIIGRAVLAAGHCFVFRIVGIIAKCQKMGITYSGGRLD